MRTASIVFFASVAALAACSPASPVPGADDIARAQSLRPGDPQLAERYERSCMGCHAVQGSGAPLTGFVPQWRPRSSQGLEQLVQHAYDGFNAMPARGQCNDCSTDDLRALIRFMSSESAA